MWNDAFIEQMQPEDIVVEVDNAETTISVGEFLDVFGTIVYKQKQITKLAQLFADGMVAANDVIFVPDIFYPGLESIRYMSELAGIPVRIVAFNHAGRADESDFVQRLGAWSDVQEQAWHDCCDVVLVGSEYHKRRVVDKFHHKDVRVTGAIWSREWMRERINPSDFKKEDYCIFPHRPSAEKRWNLFWHIAKVNPDMQFVVTTCGNPRLMKKQLPENVKYLANLTKQEYFEVFARAKYYLTCAYQETFGYTIQEAIYFGCKIIAPKYACYPEYVNTHSLAKFEELSVPYKLTVLYQYSTNLTKSTQFPDNAKTIYNICRAL